MTRNQLLTCVQGGMQKDSHETILREILMKTLEQCKILYAAESTPHFKKGSDNERGRLETDVVISPATLLQEYTSFERHKLICDETITNTVPLMISTPLSTSQALLSRNLSSGSTATTRKFMTCTSLYPFRSLHVETIP